MGYQLTGRMAEVCTCHTYCPCSAGLEPDGGVCEFNWVFHLDRGAVGDVDVSGLNMGIIGHLDGRPGVPGTVRAAIFVDDASSPEQHDALMAAFTGQEGGPLAELAAWAEGGVRGEVVIVVAGAAARGVAFPDAVTQVLELVRTGMRLKDAAAEVSGLTGHSRRELYQAALAVRG